MGIVEMRGIVRSAMTFLNDNHRKRNSKAHVDEIAALRGLNFHLQEIQGASKGTAYEDCLREVATSCQRDLEELGPKNSSKTPANGYVRRYTFRYGAFLRSLDDSLLEVPKPGKTIFKAVVEPISMVVTDQAVS